MERHLRNATATGAALALFITAGFVVEGLLPPSSGSETVSIDFDLCLNPPLWVDESGWVVNERFPSGPAREITGTFEYEGDSGTLSTDEGFKIEYSRVDGFIADGCWIN